MSEGVKVPGIIARIRENHRKLRECPAHRFGNVVGSLPLSTSLYARRHTCKVCGGEMGEDDIVVYARGYKAAGGNPDEVGKYFTDESLC